jgi:hypothetical protein
MTQFLHFEKQHQSSFGKFVKKLFISVTISLTFPGPKPWTAQASSRVSNCAAPQPKQCMPFCIKIMASRLSLAMISLIIISL